MRPGTDRIIAPERQAELFDLLGKTVGGKYKLERLLGAGGMGGVFAAKPIDGGGEVAVKVLSVVDPASRERIAGRFAREARAVTALKCPHIVTVLDAGSDDASRPYLVMELLEGEDLGQRLRRETRVPLEDTLRVAREVLVALDAAHRAGIVHRDLKPDNVFLSKRGAGDVAFCKLLDFGMSKFLPQSEGRTLALALTKKGMAVGTPYYMAPEQARALEDVDGRADLWALGAIVFECLAGRPPFIGPTQEQILIAVCTTDPPDVRALRPEVPSKVAKIITRALSRDRAKRFATAAEMLAALTDAPPAPALATPAVAVAAHTPPAPDHSGPIVATLREAPISLHDPPPKQMSRAIPIVVAVCALVLGIALTIYVLAITRHP